MEIIGYTKDGLAVLQSVHGQGLTGIERAWREYAGAELPNPYEAKFSPERIGKNKTAVGEDVDFESWLALQGLELGVDRSGAWFRVVNTKIAESIPAGSIKCRHRRNRWGRIICYGLPDSAYPFDLI